MLALPDRAVQGELTWRQTAAVPLLDLVMLCAWFAPFFSNRITWRGYEAAIGPNTELIERTA